MHTLLVQVALSRMWNDVPAKSIVWKAHFRLLLWTLNISGWPYHVCFLPLENFQWFLSSSVNFLLLLLLLEGLLSPKRPLCFILLDEHIWMVYLSLDHGYLERVLCTETTTTKTEILLTGVFELITGPENFNFLPWKEGFGRDEPFSADVFALCLSLLPRCGHWPCHQWVSTGAQGWRGGDQGGGGTGCHWSPPSDQIPHDKAGADSCPCFSL